MKYPIYNRAAYGVVAAADTLLAPFQRKKKPPTNFSSLLLCNGAHLGDVILTTSLLSVIKKARPDVKIGMLVGSWSDQVVREHPMVDEVIHIDHWKLNRKAEGKYRRYFTTRALALKRIKSYDVAVDCCFHFPNSAPLLWQAGISHRLGYVSAGLSPYLTHALPWHTSNKSCVESFYELLSEIPCFKGYQQYLKPTLAYHIAPRESYIVCHICAGNRNKEWPFEKWRELIAHFPKERFLFTGHGTRERKMIEKVIKGLSNAESACYLTWNAFVETIQRARLLVGVDTAAGHVAAAVDTPSILLYTSQHPELLWKPYTDQCIVVAENPPCRGCLKGCLLMHCLSEISVGCVQKTLQNHLAGQKIFC